MKTTETGATYESLLVLHTATGYEIATPASEDALTDAAYARWLKISRKIAKEDGERIPDTVTVLYQGGALDGCEAC